MTAAIDISAPVYGLAMIFAALGWLVWQVRP